SWAGERAASLPRLIGASPPRTGSPTGYPGRVPLAGRRRQRVVDRLLGVGADDAVRSQVVRRLERLHRVLRLLAELAVGRPHVEPELLQRLLQRQDLRAAVAGAEVAAGREIGRAH